MEEALDLSSDRLLNNNNLYSNVNFNETDYLYFAYSVWGNKGFQIYDSEVESYLIYCSYFTFRLYCTHVTGHL